MHLDGTHTLNATPKEIWQLLLDPQVLGRITPGVKSLEPQGEDVYKTHFEVKMGPVNGAFQGKMAVLDKVEPESFSLKMDIRGKIGTVAAKGVLGLKPLDGKEQTNVSFSGDANLTGTLARTGQRVLSGVAKTMTAQFFKSLEEELAASKGITIEKMSLWQRILNWFRRLFGHQDSR